MTNTNRQLRRIERKIDLLLEAAEIEIDLEVQMDEAGAALQAEIEQLDEDVASDNAVVVSLGEAVASAATKFGELKELLEKQSSGALSDEEAEQLTTLATEVDGHLGEANAQATTQVQALGADTAGA